MNTTVPSTLEPDISEVPGWLLAVHATIVAIMLVVSLLGNGIVLFLVAKYKKLRYRSILVSLGVVVADLLLPLVLHFQALVSSIAGRWPFGDGGCTGYGFLLLCVYYARWLGTAVIAIDRFLVIVAPFFYRRWSKRLLIVLFVTAWTTPFIFALPALFGFGTPTYRSTLTTCAVDCGEDRLCNIVYSLEFGTYLILGAGVPTVLYLILYCFGVKKRRAMMHRLGTQTSSEDPGVNASTVSMQHRLGTQTSSEDPGVNASTVSMQHRLGTQTPSEDPGVNASTVSMQHKLENASTISMPKILGTQTSLEVNASSVSMQQILGTPTFMEVPEVNGRRASTVSMQKKLTFLEVPDRRTSTVSMQQRLGMQRRASILSSTPLAVRERRASVTFGIVFIALVLTQLPIFIISISRRRDFYQDIPIYVHYIILYIYMLSTALDPIIVMRNRDFRHAMSQLIGRRHSRTFHSASILISRTNTFLLSTNV